MHIFELNFYFRGAELYRIGISDHMPRSICEEFYGDEYVYIYKPMSVKRLEEGLAGFELSSGVTERCGPVRQGLYRFVRVLVSNK